MKDFKIGDDVEEQNEEFLKEKYKKSRNRAIIIVVVSSLLIGVITFLISNSIFNKKDENVSGDIVLNLSDDNVQILYSFVTYSTDGVRNDIFMKNNMTLESFTNEDKFYYALQFAQADDFEFTGNMNDNNSKIYLITNRKIKQYMQQFFGPNVKYNNAIELDYPFSFKINQKNVGKMRYSEYQAGFLTTFDDYKSNNDRSMIDHDIVGELTSAKEEKSGKIVLEEKVVYTKITKNEDNTYSVDVYKNADMDTKLDTKSVNNINDNYLDLSDYNNTNVIEYTFGVNGDTYYFESSTIK